MQNMLTFREYKALSEFVRSVSTRMWACEVLYRSKAPNLNALPEFLENAGDRRSARSRQRSKFWYKKYEGECLRSDTEVRKIELLFPGTASVLLHPVWRLLDEPNPDHVIRLQIAQSLSFDVQQEILTKSRDRLKEPRTFFKLLSHQNLDSLAAYVLIYQDDETPEKAHLSFSAATSLILRLFSGKYKNITCGYYMYTLLFHAFGCHKGIFRRLVYLDEKGNEITRKKVRPSEFQISLSFDLFTSIEKFEEYCHAYSEVIALIIRRLEFINSEERALKLMAFVPHSQFHEFVWNLKIYPNHKIPLRITMLDQALDLYSKH